MKSTAPYRVKSLRVLPNWRLSVAFVDGTRGEVDLRERIFSRKAKGTFYESLREPSEFGRAAIVLGAVEWPNGANLAPDAMHEEIQKHGTWILRAK